MRLWSIGIAIALFAPSTAYGQDPIKVDPKHYTVIHEDDTFRVLRIRFGPEERSVMHDHPSGCFYLVTDFQTKETTPDGKVTDGVGKAGTAACGPAFKHSPENVGKPYEVIFYELKPQETVSLLGVSLPRRCRRGGHHSRETPTLVAQQAESTTRTVHASVIDADGRPSSG